MSSLLLCSFCLNRNVRLHLMSSRLIQDFCERVCNTKMNYTMNNVYLCYICFAQLQKCHKFVTKVTQSQRLLDEMVNTVTLELTEVKYHSELQNGPLECFSLGGVSETEHDLTRELKDVMTETDNAEPVKIEYPLKKHETKEGEHDNDVDTDNIKYECSYNSQSSEYQSDDEIPLKTLLKVRRAKPVKERRKIKSKVKKDNYRTEVAAAEVTLTKEQQVADLRARALSHNFTRSPHRCQLCYKGFADINVYENHVMKHDKRSGDFECDVCRLRYVTAAQLRAHSGSAHARIYRCGLCDHVDRTRNQARNHQKWHTGHTYECQPCGKVFRKPTSYLTHLRLHHASEFVCDACGMNFVSRHGLMTHKSKTHKNLVQPPSDESPSSRHCEACNITFATVDAWKQHIVSSRKHAGITAGSRCVKCRICNEVLPRGSDLPTHMRRHISNKKFIKSDTADDALFKIDCDECGASFKSRSNLTWHVKSIHRGIKYDMNIVCETCGKKCKSRGALVAHQRSHSGEKPYQCDSCPKQFRASYQLRLHTRTHTGEKPYCCAICGKRFTQKPALNRHYRIHTGAKPYNCQFCSKAFNQSNSLKIHIKSVHLKLSQSKKKVNDPAPEQADSKIS